MPSRAPFQLSAEDRSSLRDEAGLDDDIIADLEGYVQRSRFLSRYRMSGSALEKLFREIGRATRRAYDESSIEKRQVSLSLAVVKWRVRHEIATVISVSLSRHEFADALSAAPNHARADSNV
jgi:hypothetical protein